MIAFNRIDALYVDSIRTFGVKGNLFVLFYAIADGKVYAAKKYAPKKKRIIKNTTIPIAQYIFFTIFSFLSLCLYFRLNLKNCQARND